MIVDSSAIIAILRGEPEGLMFAALIVESGNAKLSAASYLEVGAVVDGLRDPVASREVDALLETYEVAIAPVTEAQARLAREASRDFGKGSGHPANLNFGDCFSYALAKEKGEPLLFKGNDFRHTDVQSVLP